MVYQNKKNSFTTSCSFLLTCICVCVYTCDAAMSVLEKMLLLDPEQRVSASDALDLPFFGEYRDGDDEADAQPYDQTMDNMDLTLDQWKREMTPSIFRTRAISSPLPEKKTQKN